MVIDVSRLRREDKCTFWQEQVSAWRASGLSQARFCRDHGLKVRDFGYWKRKLSLTSSAGFVPLRVRGQSASPSSPALCLVLESGLRIEVREGFSPGALRDLIHTLRAL